MQQPADLSQALDDELDCISSFRQLLESERDALTTGDLDQVAALAENKLSLGQRLQHHTEQREALRRALINDRQPDPLRSTPLANKWQRLTAMLQQAHEANRINGMLVSSRLAAVSGALNTLHSAVGAAPIYNSDGSARPIQGQSGAARWSA